MLRARKGQALVLVVVMLPVLIGIVGLAIDAGRIFDARRDLYNIADTSSRAGAMHIDQDKYRSSDGRDVVLNTGEAQQAALSYANQQGGGITASAAVSPSRITVSVQRQIKPTFLSIFNVGPVTISATASARPRHGIQNG